ncbi:MAG: hypothetical protein EKK53_29160 [Burkholderiales bacterium]|nr:MAG: hypothetical protein EKK53_29160 [Burkholderiales bacterium]
MAAGPLARAAPSLAADCRADQADRAAYRATNGGPGWTGIAQRDGQRQQRVRAAVKAGRLRRAEDFRCAALILLHAGDETALRLAFSLAVQGQVLDPQRPALARLAADAWDRLMMARQQPQWFATQFVATGGDATRFQLYPVQPGLMSEAERARLGGLTDAEIQAELARLNARPAPAAPASPAPPGQDAAPLPVTADATLLLATLDTDLGLANTLAQLLQEGLPAPTTSDGSTPTRLLFIPRDADALRRYFERQVPRIPRFEGSATPTSASAAEIQVDTRNGRVWRVQLGIDDAVQAAATLTVRPNRVFTLTVAQRTAGGPLTLTHIERQP